MSIFNVCKSFACMYVYEPHEYLVLTEDRRGHRIPSDWLWAPLNPPSTLESSQCYWPSNNLPSPLFFSFFLFLLLYGFVRFFNDPPEFIFHATIFNDHFIYSSPCAHPFSWLVCTKWQQNHGLFSVTHRKPAFPKTITQSLVITLPEYNLRSF